MSVEWDDFDPVLCWYNIFGNHLVLVIKEEVGGWTVPYVWTLCEGGRRRSNSRRYGHGGTGRTKTNEREGCVCVFLRRVFIGSYDPVKDQPRLSMPYFTFEESFREV